MAITEIKQGIFTVGAVDWDRRLFDELIPLPDGTTYNSYLIKGHSKTALIDTVDPSKESVLVDNLRQLGFPPVDYIISHHAEQDHSGTIPKILDIYPNAKVVTNPKCKEMLKDLLLIPDASFIEVKDRETLSLGNKTLEFVYTPWVHWPETMVTYLCEDKILFSCDLFGSHLAVSDLYAKSQRSPDDFGAVDEARVYESAKRYYAEIMMPFRSIIQKHLEKVKALDIKLIAPSHGPLYNNPQFIVDAYADWASDKVKNEVVIPYVSMHGSIARMVEYFIDALIKQGVTVKPFNLTKTDIGELAISLVDAATIVIGSPTVLTGPHPAIAYAAYLANALRPKAKFASIIGSYGWGGKMAETIAGMLSNLKVEIIPPVIIKGHPKSDDFKALDKLADEIAQRHKQIK